MIEAWFVVNKLTILYLKWVTFILNDRAYRLTNLRVKTEHRNFFLQLKRILIIFKPLLPYFFIYGYITTK